MKKHLLGAAVAGLFSITAQAADIGVDFGIGTQGIGAHLVVPVSDNKLNARVGLNAYDYSFSGSTDDIDYDLDLKLKNIDALLDYYPMSGSFRLTAGVVYNGNEVNANGRPNAAGSYVFNGRTYTAADVGSLNGKIDFRNVAPYLGFGWGNAVAKDKGFGFTADFGVLFQGSPRTSLTNTGCVADATTCAQFAEDVAAENQRFNDEAEDFQYYPVARIGVTYRF